MDGIDITQVVSEEPPVFQDMSAPALASLIASEDTSFNGVVEHTSHGEKRPWDVTEKELESEQIADMIRINEGLETCGASEQKSPERPNSPHFKHFDKLTPNIPRRLRMLSTKSLKKSFLKKRKHYETDDDESDAFVEPLRKKFKSRENADIKNRLAEEMRQLKILRKEKKKLELETKKLRKDRLKQVKKLQREARILNEIEKRRGLKRKGRSLGFGKMYANEQKALEGEISENVTSSSEDTLSDELPTVATTVKMDRSMKKKGRPLGSGKKLRREMVERDESLSENNLEELHGLSPRTPIIVKTRSGRTRKPKPEFSNYVLHSKVANIVVTGGLDKWKSAVIPEEPAVPPPTPPKCIERRGRKKGWNKLNNFGKINETVEQSGQTEDPAAATATVPSDTKNSSPLRKRRGGKDRFVMSYKKKKRRLLMPKKQINGYGTEISFGVQQSCDVPSVSIEPAKEEADEIQSSSITEVAKIHVVDIPKDKKETSSPNGVIRKSVRRGGLSEETAPPLDDELTVLRSTWDDLMGTSTCPAVKNLEVTSYQKQEDASQLGVENDSPPLRAANEVKESRDRPRKRRSNFTSRKRVRRKIAISNQSSEPLKEKQNIVETVKAETEVVTTVKKERDVSPRTSDSVIEKTHEPKPCRVVITKDQLVETLSQQREEDELKNKRKIKMQEKRQTRTSLRLNRSSPVKVESYVGSYSSQGVVHAAPESTPRRSLREVKLTEKMVELMTHHDMQVKKLNEEKMECYEHLITRGASGTPEILPNDLFAKVALLSKHFQCTWLPGDLLWTRVGEYPFWPSILIQDPFCFDEYSKIKCLDGEPEGFIHVQFLHDRGRRAWVPHTFVAAFKGREHFQELGETDDAAKDEHFRDALEVTKIHLKSWNEAVKEGEVLLSLKPMQRLVNIRRRNPLERYGDCSSLVGNVTEIPDVIETFPLPLPVVPVEQTKKSGTKSQKLTDKKKKEDANVEVSPAAFKIKIEKKKGQRVEAKMENEKKTKHLQLAEKIRDERAPSEDSTSAFEKESTSSLDLLSLETKRAKKFLFKGLGDEKICDTCRGIKNEITVQCRGQCHNFFHPSCLSLESSPSNNQIYLSDSWLCDECTKGQNSCFVCKKVDGTRQMCLTAGCGKFYHNNCLKLFPQAKFNRGPRKGIGLQREPGDTSGDDGDPPPEILACPLHTCHTCASDNTVEGQLVPSDKLVRCIKCPTSYHSGYFCVPAGTEVKTTSQILCGKHFEPPPKSKLQYHYNINWCFICCKGGTLICCDSCPSSFHAECLPGKNIEDSFICEECESGRFPLHGEIVWAKLAKYRWWPAKILYPQEIPQNLVNMKRRQCEFAVQFYGSRDYQWVNRGRAFLYQEGDAKNNIKSGKGLDISYERAVVEANNEFQARKEALSQRESSKTVGKPPPFAKIKTNKYIAKPQKNTEERPFCDCDPMGDMPCSPNSNCLNRMLMVECDRDSCRVGDKCMNRCFERKQYPLLQPYKTHEKGWGLRSKVDLVKGQFVIEYVGEVIDEEEFKSRMKKKQENKDSNFYFLTLDSNRYIDAGPRGNLARFMNHSCDPNCETQKWKVNGLTRVGLFALKDIPKDTELTFNYHLDCLGDERKKLCFCESVGCSGFIGSKPIKAEPEHKNSHKSKVKSKSKSKKASRSASKSSDSACFKCGEGGELMLCDAASCARACHVACAGLDSWPNEPWYCNSHNCAVCKKTTKRCCSTCGVAYCSNHIQGNIYTEHSILYCTLHAKKNKRTGQKRRSSYLNRRTQGVASSSVSSIAGDFQQKDGAGRVEDEVISDPLKRVHGVDTQSSELNSKDIKEFGNSMSVSVQAQEDTESEIGVDDLIPATDFNSSSPVVFTDPDGRVIDIDPESLIPIDTIIESPTKRPKKRTNIPREKIKNYLKSPVPKVAD